MKPNANEQQLFRANNYYHEKRRNRNAAEALKVLPRGDRRDVKRQLAGGGTSATEESEGLQGKKIRRHPMEDPCALLSSSGPFTATTISRHVQFVLYSKCFLVSCCTTTGRGMEITFPGQVQNGTEQNWRRREGQKGCSGI